MSFCKYRGVFGEPGSGIHSYRVFDIAIFDVLFTVIFAYYISNNTDEFYKNSILLFIFGIIIHRLFCVDTTINKIIFGNTKQ